VFTRRDLNLRQLNAKVYQIDFKYGVRLLDDPELGKEVAFESRQLLTFAPTAEERLLERSPL
jgi:hypothetical protein